MIGLERHIEILLLSNDCVIVPGFGGFMAHYVPSHYDDADGMFLPPLRTLGFNPQLTMNDSLIAQSYAEYYDISYPEALHRIENEVDELRQHLRNEGRYELRGIGTLSMNDEGNVEFEPFEAGLLTPELYGLGGFEMPLQKVESAPSATTVNEPTAHRKARTVALISENEQGEKVVSVKMSLLRNIAAAAITIVALFLIPAPTGEVPANAPVNHTESSLLPPGIILEKPSVKTTQELSATHKTAQQPAAKPSATTAPKAATYWCLVLCSHVSKENAKALTAQLKGEGFADARVHQGAESVKVVYGHYATQENAYAALRDLRANSHFKDSWVLELDNK